MKTKSINRIVSVGIMSMLVLSFVIAVFPFSNNTVLADDPMQPRTFVGCINQSNGTPLTVDGIPYSMYNINTSSYANYTTNPGNITDPYVFVDSINANIGHFINISCSYGGESGYAIGIVHAGINWLNVSLVAPAGANNAPTVNNVAPGNASTGNPLSVTLNVTIDDDDGDTMTVNFYNGTYGSSSHLNVQTGKSNGSVTYTWSSLAYSTTYHWYATVYDGTDNTTGIVWSFTTVAQGAPVVNTTSLVPSDGASNQAIPPANISGYVYDPDGDTINVTAWIVTDTASRQTTYANVSNGTFGIATAHRNEITSFATTYSWGLNITDGTYWTNTTYTFTTRSAYVPNVPTSFTATAYTYNQINLSWTKGSYADRTVIVRKNGSYPTGVTDGTVAYNNTGTSYADTPIASSTSWYYRAWSFNATDGRFSATYASATATTPAPNYDYTVVVLANTTSADEGNPFHIKIYVNNTGDMPFANMTVNLTYPSGGSNITYTGNYSTIPAGSSITDMGHGTGYRYWVIDPFNASDEIFIQVNFTVNMGTPNGTNITTLASVTNDETIADTGQDSVFVGAYTTHIRVTYETRTGNSLTQLLSGGGTVFILLAILAVVAIASIIIYILTRGLGGTSGGKTE